MNLQRLADWGMTEVSNKRIRVLLGYLLPAGMQIWQVGSTVEPGAHPSRRVFGRRGTWRPQSDKPHHFLVLTQKASLIPGSTPQTSPDQNLQWMAKDGTLISATKLLGLIRFWLYRKEMWTGKQNCSFFPSLKPLQRKWLWLSEPSSKEITHQAGHLAEGGLRCFSFIQSIDFKVPSFKFLWHSVCQHWNTLADRMWMDQLQLLPAHRNPGWPSTKRSCWRNIPNLECPETMVLALSIRIMKEGKDQRTSDRNPASHFCSKIRRDNSLAGLLWDCSNFERT